MPGARRAQRLERQGREAAEQEEISERFGPRPGSVLAAVTKTLLVCPRSHQIPGDPRAWCGSCGYGRCIMR